MKKFSLKQISVFSHKFEGLKTDKGEEAEKIEKPRMMSECGSSSHKVFKSHPFLDNALKSRNRILPKPKGNQENELSIPENRSPRRIVEGDQLKAKKIIKKRNINELKLQEIIK